MTSVLSRGMFSRRVSTDDGKGPAAIWPEPEYGEVVVKRSGAFDPEPTHDRETRAVYKRKILIAPGHPNLPGDFDVCRAGVFYGRYATSQPFPETFRRVPIYPVTDQRPRFGQNVIARDECLARSENGFCARVVAIRCVAGRIRNEISTKRLAIRTGAAWIFRAFGR